MRYLTPFQHSFKTNNTPSVINKSKYNTEKKRLFQENY